MDWLKIITLSKLIEEIRTDLLVRNPVDLFRYARQVLQMFDERNALNFLEGFQPLPDIISHVLPPGRWAAHIPEEQLPPLLRETHADYPEFLQWVPRRWTSWVAAGPAPKLYGNAKEVQWHDGTLFCKPIPARGEWFASRGYFAMTLKNGIHFRIGARFDDVDSYFTFPTFSLKSV